jgi:hypothetical protein
MSQEFDIPLSSPLEIEGDFTVVGAGDPTFMSKPMAKYNALLGNSVKFEDDGWFYDWKRFTMSDSIDGGAITVSPADFAVERFQRDGNLFFLVFDNGTSTWIDFGPQQPAGVTVTRLGNVLNVSFNMPLSGRNIIAQFNASTLELLNTADFHPSTGGAYPELSLETSVVDNKLLVTVSEARMDNDFIEVQYPHANYVIRWEDGEEEPVDLNLNNRTYTSNGTTHNFNGVLQLGPAGVTSLLAENVVPNPADPIDNINIHLIRNASTELALIFRDRLIDVFILGSGNVRPNDTIQDLFYRRHGTFINVTNIVNSYTQNPSGRLIGDVGNIFLFGTLNATVTQTFVQAGGMTTYTFTLTTTVTNPTDPQIDFELNRTQQFSSGPVLTDNRWEMGGTGAVRTGSFSLVITAPTPAVAGIGSYGVTVGFNFTIPVIANVNATISGLSVTSVNNMDGTVTGGFPRPLRRNIGMERFEADFEVEVYDEETVVINWITNRPTRSIIVDIEGGLFPMIGTTTFLEIDVHLNLSAYRNIERRDEIPGIIPFQVNVRREVVEQLRDDGSGVSVSEGLTYLERMWQPQITVSDVSDADYFNLDFLPDPENNLPLSRQYQVVILNYVELDAQIWMMWRKGRFPEFVRWRSVGFVNSPNVVHELTSVAQFTRRLVINPLIYRFENVYADIQPFLITDRQGSVSTIAVSNITGVLDRFTVITNNPNVTLLYNNRNWTSQTSGWDVTFVQVTGRIHFFRGDFVTHRISPIGTHRTNIVPGNFVSAAVVGGNFVLQFDGYTVTIPSQMSSGNVWASEDLRTRQTTVLRRYTQPEYIICQSHWNDDTEKDCWVIDRNSLMTIGFNDTVKYYRKTGRPGVFQTFEWTLMAQRSRSSYNFDQRHGISSALNTQPVIWSLRYTASGMVLRYMVAPTSTAAFESSLSWTSVNISNLPHMGNTTWEALYNGIRISTTRLQSGVFMFAMAFDKGIKQWTLRINGASISSTVVGFGHVGVDGTMTGGQYPTDDVGSNGFTGSPQIGLPEELDDLSGIYDVGGTIYFTDDFTRLCYAINASGGKVEMPFIQKKESKETDDKNVRQQMGIRTGMFGILIMLYLTGRNGTMSSAFVETISSSWKTHDDLDAEQFFTIENEQSQNVSTSNLALITAALGQSVAGSVNSALTNDNPMNQLGVETANLMFDANDLISAKGDVLGTDTGVHRAILKLSDFYSVNQNSHIHAGPGFVQSQLVKTMSQNAAGFGVIKYSEDGAGTSPMYAIQIPTPMVGFSNNPIAHVWKMFGEYQIHAFNTGLQQASIGKQLPYRRYGYSHRYINFPTKDNVTHNLTDITVDFDADLKEEIGSSDYRRTVNIPQASAQSVSNSVTSRASVITGSMLPPSVITSARRGDQSFNSVQFSAPFIYDYCVHPGNDLYFSAIDQEVVHVSIHDTKVLDGLPSNVVISGRYTLLGSGYCGIEVLPPEEYALHHIRPKAVTPQTLLLNTTGINAIHADRLYHACDAYSNRVVAAQGTMGIDIEIQNSISTYRADDGFKVSSIFPPFSVFGKFSSPFAIAYNHIIETYAEFYKSLHAPTEVKEAFRFSMPVIFNRLAHLPAVGKTLAAYQFGVVDGVTGLCTELRTTQPLNRRPDSLDFPIYGQIYRWNPEYISQVLTETGTVNIRALVATIGLSYKGSTPNDAWFHSAAVRAFYKFSPSTVTRVMNADRFKEISEGTFDFVEQEVVMKVRTNQHESFVRINQDKFIGEIIPPNETIGPYEFYSMAGGIVFQGNKRFQVNRFLITDDMVADIKRNRTRWGKPEGKTIKNFWDKRDYRWRFELDSQNRWRDSPPNAVRGWFLEPYPLATGYLGVDDYSECKFEWLINLAISDIMLDILEDHHITVYFASETMTVGGVKESQVSRLRLHRKMFVRQGQYGYYSYKFNGDNGIGDSERLYMWSDGPVLLRSLKLLANSVTQKRTSPMETYEETKRLSEF